MLTGNQAKSFVLGQGKAEGHGISTMTHIAFLSDSRDVGREAKGILNIFVTR
jgi:hypothetical protein